MAVRGFPSALLLLGVNVLVARAVVAQNIDSVRASYTLPLPPHQELFRPTNWISPGSSSGTPTAYGAQWGDVFFGASYQTRVRYSTLNDGDAYVGFGLGNPQRLIGMELVYTSYTTVRHGFFKEGAFSFKLHRELPANLAVAFGWEDAIHTTGTDGGSSKYGVITSFIPTRRDDSYFLSSVTLSAGIGNGRFQTEEAFYAEKRGVNGFGSIGIRVFRPISVFADWTGQDLMLGASVVPFPRLPLVITPAWADVTGKAGDGARFVIGAGLDYSFVRR